MITDLLEDRLPFTGSNVPDPNNIGKVAKSYQKVESFEGDFTEDNAVLGTIGGFGTGIVPTMAVAGTAAFNPLLGAATIGLAASGAAAGGGYGKIHEDRAEDAEDYFRISEEDAIQLIDDADDLSYFEDSIIPGRGGYEAIETAEIDDVYEEIASEDSETFLRWFEDEGNDENDWLELTVYQDGVQEVYGGSIDNAESYASEMSLTDEDAIKDMLE